MSAVHTRRAETTDLDGIVEVLTDSFVDDPVMSWVFPDAQRRPARLAVMFGFLAEYRYLPAGASTVCIGATGEIEAAALWEPTSGDSVTRDDFWERHGAAFVAALDGEVERLSILGETMQTVHPPGAHWYLLAVGVRPARQGRGLGTALLAPTLEALDTRSAAAYLEATSPRSRALYRRLGFEDHQEIDLDEHGDRDVRMWAMWRPPTDPGPGSGRLDYR